MSQSQWTLPVPDFDVQDFSNEIVSTPVVVDNAISNFKASSAGSNIQGAPQMFLEPTVCRVRPRGSISTNSSDTLDESHPQSGNSSEEPPLVRKGHSKSRRGCYNCKRRRVKCPENHPSCAQCTRRGIQCEYPEIQIRQSNAIAKRPIPVPKELPSEFSTFTIQDFRLFNHFIQSCYPHQPIGNDSVWTHEVPSIAHNYNYLLHSMLALAASDLDPCGTDTALSTVAISHRVKAIKLLNRALSTNNLTSEQGNAMLATCYTLVFQSALIDDGLAEFMTFIRGCVLVLYQMGVRNLKFLFHTIISEEVVKKLDPHLKQMPEVDLEAAQAGLKSLEAFQHLCVRETEKEFHGHLMDAVKGLFSTPKEAYSAVHQMYGVFSWKMSHEDFQSFINPDNVVGQLLQSHFVAVQNILTPITIVERTFREVPDTNPGGKARWLDVIHNNIKPGMRKYFEWPIAITEAAERKALERRDRCK